MIRKIVCVIMASILAIVFSGCETAADRFAPQIEYRTNVDSMPVFVKSKAEFVNIGRTYVLPDGQLWHYGDKTVEIFHGENKIPDSIDEDGNVVGLQKGIRYSSEDIPKEQPNVDSTGFIPVSPGDVLRFEGIQFRNEKIGDVAPGSIYIRLYDASFCQLTGIGAYELPDKMSRFSEAYEQDEYGNISCLTLNNKFNYAYIRLSFVPIKGQEAIITVNEDLGKQTETVTQWFSEEYLTEDWYAEVMDTVATVKSLPVSGHKTQFLFDSDIHLDPNQYNYELVNDIGKISAGVMQACEIPYFLNLGDSTTQASDYQLSDLTANMQAVMDVFSPIPWNNILLTVGNHDGATGKKEVNGELLHYRYQLSNEDRAALYFGWQRENSEKIFGPDGSYYYFDDDSTQTRYIMLNGFWTEHKADKTGFVEDINHSFFKTPILGQEQLSWFAQEALNMPKGYGAVIGMHNAISPRDSAVFADIVEAYNNKEWCNSIYTGEQEWQSSKIVENFSHAKGEIIAIFQGHNHKDYIDTETFAVPCITITTAGADVRDDLPVERIAGTSTETAVDVVTIDRENHIIYLTRLGAGEDRSVHY